MRGIARCLAARRRAREACVCRASGWGGRWRGIYRGVSKRVTWNEDAVKQHTSSAPAPSTKPSCRHSNLEAMRCSVLNSSIKPPCTVRKKTRRGRKSRESKARRNARAGVRPFLQVRPGFPFASEANLIARQFFADWETLIPMAPDRCGYGDVTLLWALCNTQER